MPTVHDTEVQLAEAEATLVNVTDPTQVKALADEIVTLKEELVAEQIATEGIATAPVQEQTPVATKVVAPDVPVQAPTPAPKPSFREAADAAVKAAALAMSAQVPSPTHAASQRPALRPTRN